MGRMRTGRLAAMVAVIALAMTISAIPGIASAHGFSKAVTWTKPARVRPLRIQSGLIAAAADDDIPGTAKTVPFTATDSLTTGLDVDDVYAIHLNAGDRLVVRLNGEASSDMDIFLFAPDATTVNGDAEPIDGSTNDGSIEQMLYTIDTSGTYYIDAYLASGLGGAYTLSAGIDVTADDEIPGISETAPFTVSDALGTGTDVDDVYSFYLAAGQTTHVNLTGQAGTDFDIDLFTPDSTSIFDDAVAWSENAGTSTESFVYTATTSGLHYILVYQVSGSPGGTYTLNADATATSPTSITIRTSATTARIGSVPILAGAVTPASLVGQNIVVYVMKPGKTYWTYSSNRTVYALGGGAAWQYKYAFKKGMAKGTYKFKSSVPAWPGYLTSTSPTTVSVRLQ